MVEGKETTPETDLPMSTMAHMQTKVINSVFHPFKTRWQPAPGFCMHMHCAYTCPSMHVYSHVHACTHTHIKNEESYTCSPCTTHTDHPQTLAVLRLGTQGWSAQAGLSVRSMKLSTDESNEKSTLEGSHTEGERLR